MKGSSLFDDGRANSLVFTITEELSKNYCGPEPDFLRWLDQAWYMDEFIAGDEAGNGKLPEKEREAWKLFYDAIQATRNLLELYKEDVPLFQKMAGELMLLPCFQSRHPDNLRFNREYLENSRLSQVSMASACQPKGPHMARQSWPVRYAYAIIFTIELTLDTYETRLPEWAEIYGYGIKHPISMSRYEEAARKLGWDEEKKRLELPSYVDSYEILPAWTRSLKKLRRPYNQKHVLDYWHTGKEMILEEMPDFHLRPEWDDYRNRRAYQTGRKKGAIQHAIFKDILAALKSIAGSNHKHRRTAPKPVTK
jgi:hypothetical protein